MGWYSALLVVECPESSSFKIESISIHRSRPLYVQALHANLVVIAKGCQLDVSDLFGFLN